LDGQDDQVRLEAAIALGECSTDESVELLCDIVRDQNRPFFLRSAAAWSLSQTRTPSASKHLVQAFSDVNITLREEALDGLATIGSSAIPALLDGLGSADETVSAGAAEALRRNQPLAKEVIDRLIGDLATGTPQKWAVWLIGHLPREHFASAVASLQSGRPELHYAVSLLWSFVESWIARRWELRPTARMLDSGTP
jgi:HEAT repeat protein